MVEEEGVDAATEEESQQLLQLFIQHIKVCVWFTFSAEIF